MSTEVVYVLRVMEAGDPFVYVGRRNARYGLEQSPYSNPFPVSRQHPRGEVIADYAVWLCNRPWLLERAHELAGKRLACWCHPKACHADLLVEIADMSKSGASIEVMEQHCMAYSRRVRPPRDTSLF